MSIVFVARPIVLRVLSLPLLLRFVGCDSPFERLGNGTTLGPAGETDVLFLIPVHAPQ
jgi:hypothetical protein